MYGGTLRSTNNPLLVEGALTPSDDARRASIRWKYIQDDITNNREKFIKYRSHTIWVGTWNVNGRDVGGSLVPWMQLAPYFEAPDIVFIGLQEIDRRPEAYMYSVSIKETTWSTYLLENIQTAYDSAYKLVASRTLVGIYAALFIKTSLVEEDAVGGCSSTVAPCGLMGVVGNKGAVAIRIKLHDEYLCFVSSHLAPHTSNVARRNQDYVDLCRRLVFPPDSSRWREKAFTSSAIAEQLNDSAEPTSIWDCGMVFWCGDLNYRIDLAADQVIELIQSERYSKLLYEDQLLKEMKAGRVFQIFSEGDITFPPSYKYQINTNEFHNNTEQHRVPAYTDRILYRTSDALQVLNYTMTMELKSSDHKPVACLFGAHLQKIDPALFEAAYDEALRRMDRFENEAIPITAVSKNVIHFDELVYQRESTQSFALLNTGQVIARFTFIPKIGSSFISAPWIRVHPMHGILSPGSSQEIKVRTRIGKDQATQFNRDEGVPEDILILHVEGGKDHFVYIGPQDISWILTNICRLQ